MESDAQWLGFELPEPAEDDDFAVMPENWQALEVFLSCQTQWKIVAGMGGCFYQGLDYPALESVLNLRVSKRKKRAKLFRQVQLIERGALEVINSKS